MAAAATTVYLTALLNRIQPITIRGQTTIKNAVEKKKKECLGQKQFGEPCCSPFDTPITGPVPATHKTCTSFSSSRYFSGTDTMHTEEMMTLACLNPKGCIARPDGEMEAINILK